MTENEYAGMCTELSIDLGDRIDTQTLGRVKKTATALQLN